VKWACKVPNFGQGLITRKGLFAPSTFAFVTILVIDVLTIIPNSFSATDG
jgi:hypothetical protein